jgi:hypothetical protein
VIEDTSVTAKVPDAPADAHDMGAIFEKFGARRFLETLAIR